MSEFWAGVETAIGQKMSEFCAGIVTVCKGVMSEFGWFALMLRCWPICNGNSVV